MKLYYNGIVMLLQDVKLRLSTSWGLNVRMKSGSNTSKGYQEVLQREMELHLPAMAAFDTYTFDLVILADMTNFPRDSTTMGHKVPVNKTPSFT
jgi:hypothetical protein